MLVLISLCFFANFSAALGEDVGNVQIGCPDGDWVEASYDKCIVGFTKQIKSVS